MTATFFKRWAPSYLPIILLIFSVTLNVLLARKIRDLRQIEVSLRTEADLQPGEIVPALQAKTVDGGTVFLRYGSAELPMVVYVLSATCKWCDRNERSVEVLSRSISSKYRFIGLSIVSTDLKPYLTERNLPFPVYADPDVATYSAYKLGNATPQTIVVSSQGSVLKNWHGAYTDALKREIEGFFNISLPELASK